MLLKDGSSSPKRRKLYLAVRSNDGSSSMSLTPPFHTQRRKESRHPKQFLSETFKSVDKKGKMRVKRNGNLSLESRQLKGNSLCSVKTRLRGTCGCLLLKHCWSIVKSSMRLRMKIQTLQKDFDWKKKNYRERLKKLICIEIQRRRRKQRKRRRRMKKLQILMARKRKSQSLKKIQKCQKDLKKKLKS